MMTVSAKTLRLDSLTFHDRLALVEEVWASICADPESFSLTDANDPNWIGTLWRARHSLMT